MRRVGALPDDRRAGPKRQVLLVAHALIGSLRRRVRARVHVRAPHRIRACALPEARAAGPERILDALYPT